MNAKYQRRKLTNAERSATENTDCMVDALAKLLFARPWIAAAKAAATFTLRAKLSGAVYCNRSCLWVWVFVCLWDCYHDNSKLRASIPTKLCL